MATVLVIDDDPNIRRVVRRVLEQDGHAVIEAENGKVALRRFMGEPTDLVISDIYMPEMDGIELFMRLKETYPEATLIAMSGGGAIAAQYLLKAASALGAVAVVEKPFSVETLRDLVSDLLKREVA